MNVQPARRYRPHLLNPTRIFNRRGFTAFTAVTFVVAFLLFALQIALRYALKNTVEDQLDDYFGHPHVPLSSVFALAGQTESPRPKSGGPWQALRCGC